MFNGNRLKKLRVSKGLTQEELGRAVNVTKVSICCYEKNNRTPNIETLLDLSEVLETTPNYLLGSEVKAVVNEDKGKYNVHISKEDLEIITEIKKHFKLYQQLCENPKKIIKKIDNIIN